MNKKILSWVQYTAMGWLALLVLGCTSSGYHTVFTPEDSVSYVIENAQFRIDRFSFKHDGGASKTVGFGNAEMVAQLQSECSHNLIKETLENRHPDLFSTNPSAVPVSVRVKYSSLDETKRVVASMLTLTLFPLLCETQLDFEVVVEPQIYSVDSAQSTMKIQRMLTESFWPVGLLPAPFQSDIPQVKMEKELALSERSIRYVQEQVADAVVRALARYPKEDVKRMQLLHQNRQLIVE